MSDESPVVHTIKVDTTPELAFEAVTATSELREWCSDEARTEVRPNGRYELRWNSGYRAEGRFVEVEPPRRAVTTWLGTGEPGETQVAFAIEQQPEGVEVTVTHRGFGLGEAWEAARAEADAGWSSGLENLQSTLETGIDLRLARRPFLGITLDLLTPERAEREGIDAEHGIYVSGTVEGSGAEAAGLENGDVIVAVDGVETPGFAELGEVLRSHRAGDEITLHLVRGQAHEKVPVTLGQRPQPELPTTPGELADQLVGRMAEVNAALKAALEGVSDEEAGRCPGEGDWSVKQILAHLSDGERGFHTLVVNMAINGWLDAGSVHPDQIPGRLEAIIAIAPTLQALLDRFLIDERETVELLRRLPAETVAHKARFRRIAQFALFGPDHTEEHVAQIKHAVECVRGG